MTAEHFKEVLYSIMLTTKTNKKDICQHLNISRETLHNYICNGLPTTRGFMVLDQLKVYLFRYLGETHEVYENIHL